jgi:hypothetical protein
MVSVNNAYNYKRETPGEHLCSYLFDNLIDSGFWVKFEERHLSASGRAQQYHQFFRESLALNLTRRLILFAEKAKDHLNPTDPGFVKLLNPAISRWGLLDINGTGKISRLAKESVVAANHGISDTMRKHFLRKALRQSEPCYLCGCVLNHDLKEHAPKHNDLTLDHIWPQSYGGDSIELNILPACRSCNSNKKQDFPSWAGCDVHSLILSVNPSKDALNSIQGRYRFALHNRYVKELAVERRISLRDAYLEVGSWCRCPWVEDMEEVADFFNLNNYSPTNDE